MSVFISLVIVICSISVILTSNQQVIAQEASGGLSADRVLTTENFKYGFKISYPASWACNQPPLPLSTPFMMLCPTIQNIDSYTFHSLIGGIKAQKGESYLANELNNTLERSASLAIWVLPSFNQPLDSYVNDKIRELQGYGSNSGSSLSGAAPDFHLIHITPNYNIGNNIRGYEVVYTLTLDGQQKKVDAIWAINGNHAYEFIYLSDPSIYSTYLPVVQSIVNSFEFIS